MNRMGTNDTNQIVNNILKLKELFEKVIKKFTIWQNTKGKEYIKI